MKSLNNALKLVNHEWVKPMAADDLLNKSYFEKISSKIKRYKFDIFICNLNFINERSEIIDLADKYYLIVYQHYFLKLIFHLLKYRMTIPSSRCIEQIY